MKDEYKMCNPMRLYGFVTITATLFAPAARARAADPTGYAAVGDDVLDLIAAEKYVEAEAAIRETRKSDPCVLAWLLFKQGRNDDAVALLNGALRQAASKHDAVELSLRCLATVADSSTGDAIQFAESLLKSAKFKDNPKLRLRLSSLYVRERKPDEARALADGVLQTDYVGEDLKQSLFDIITFYYGDLQPDLGLTYFDKLMIKIPETRLDPGEQLLWARMAAAAGRPLEALKKIDEIETKFPRYYEENKGMCHISKGIAYEKIGDRAQSRNECRRVVDLAAQNPQYQPLALIAEDKLREFEQLDEADRAMRDAIAKAASARASDASVLRGGAQTRLLIAAVGASPLLVCAGVLLWRRMKT